MAIVSNSRMTKLTGRKWWFQPRIGKGGPCGHDIGDGVFCNNPMMQPIPAALVADFSQATLEPQGSNPDGVTATFTRDSTATVVDFEGRVIEVLDGEARFQGARRVHNLIADSETIAIGPNWAGWFASINTITPNRPDPLGGTTAFRVESTFGTADKRSGICDANPGINAQNKTILISVWLRADVPQDVRLSNGSASEGVQGAFAIVSVTTNWTRFVFKSTYTNTNNNNRTFGIHSDLINGNFDIEIWHPQSEIVDGQSNQNPSEYVASPGQHGANVDGVKYFTYRNGNTVDADGVVTEAQGAPISGIAYLNEPAATNTAVQSENLTTGWSASVDAIIVDHETISFEGNASQRIYAPVGAAVVGQETVGSIYLKGVPGNKVIVSLYTSEEDGAWDDYSVVFTLTDKYVRHEIKRTWASTGNRTMFIGTHPDNPVQVINATYIQHEVGSTPTSYIPTAGATVTRAEDRLVYNNVVANGECAIAIDAQFTRNSSAGQVRLFGTDDSRGTNYELRTFNNPTSISQYSNGLSGNIGSEYIGKETRTGLGLSIGNNVVLAVNGQQQVSVARTMALDHSNTNNWGIGNWIGNLVTPLLIHSASIFDQALTDEQLKWLSTPGNVPPVA